MKFKINISSSKHVFFKRWQNKGFSILNSLGKIIIILVLPLIYIAGSFSFAFSQNDTVGISEIIVKRRPILDYSIVNIFNKEDIDAFTSTNLSDALDGSLGLDFQQRGLADIQSDISIRGGNFDQTLILLNGIPISDPQTGHNSFTLPIPFYLISKIYVHQGPATNIYGSGAYSGAINIVTQDFSSNKLYIGGLFGQHNTQNYCFGYLFNKNKHNTLLSASYKKSDDYTENTDYDAGNLFFYENYRSNKFSLSFQTSVSAKRYGAMNFYTPNFPYQHEIIGKINSGINAYFGSKMQHKISIFYNLHYDRFELFREGANWYKKTGDFWIKNNSDTAKYAQSVYQSWSYYPGHNYHKTQTVGASIGSNFSTIWGDTYYGLFIQNDNIKSSNLGFDLDSSLIKPNSHYTKGDNRLIYNAYIEQLKQIGSVNFSAGANVIYNNIFGIFHSFSCELSYLFSNRLSSYISVNQGVRLPTFTDLYYTGPSNEGNINLKPEKATTYEFGYKFNSQKLTVKSAVFYRMGKNSIDWVKFNEADKWQTMNYAELNTAGFEFLVVKKFDINLIKTFNINYTYLSQNKPQINVFSKYSLNYLKHNLSISTSHEIFNNLIFSWTTKLNYRNGSYFYFDETTNSFSETDFSPFWLVDAKLSYKLKFATFYIQASNLFNTEYYDLSYLILPGRWVNSGLRLEF